MTLKTKMVLLFILPAVASITIVSGLAFHNSMRSIEQQTRNHLGSINRLKSSELNRWVEDAKLSLQKLAQRPLVRRYVALLPTKHSHETDFSGVKKKLIQDHLRMGLAFSCFRELSVLSLDHGIILASTNRLQEGKFRDDRPFFIKGRVQTYVQDIYFSAVLEQPTMTIGTPIMDARGGVLAVLAARLDLSELSRIMEHGRGAESAADTYLVNAFNFFVTEPRFGKGYALKKTLYTQAVETCLSGKSGGGLYRDYRGEPVIGAYDWLKNHNMGIITEIDQAAAYAPIYKLAWSIVLVTLAVIGAKAGVGFYFARTLSRPLRQLVNGTQEVGRGNLDFRVGVSSNDEIGELSRAFDRMTEQLQKTTVSREEIRKLNLELEQRVAERTAELKNINAFRDSIMQNSPIGIVVYRQSGPCVLANQSAADLIDASVEQVLAQSFRTIASWQNTGLLSRAEKCLETGETQTAVVKVTSTFGRQIWVEARFSRFQTRDNTYLLLLFDDITGLKEKEDALRDNALQLQAANKELEAFAYSVSHDLRAPLRAIDGYTRILEEDYLHVFDDEGRRLLAVICGEAARMGNLIDALLSYSRLGRTEMRFSGIDMAALADSVFFELTTAGQRERIDFEVEALPPAQGDPTLIRQVWMNLIANAIKYSSYRDRAVIRVSGTCGPNENTYSIRDNGAGFDMRYADKLFGVFQRLHNAKEFEGTGVGLANVWRAVIRHGGRVWAEGEPGQGAVFYFTLPGT